MVKKLYTKIKSLYEKYERVLIPGTLVFGIIFDSITFASIEIRIAFLILGAHILLAGATIVFLNLYDKDVLGTLKNNRLLRYIRLASLLIIQFTFGALLSACFIFYFFSGSFYVSWPFILLIVILLISNDVFREYYLRAQVQISVYFFLLFSVFAIVLPYILEILSAWIFILSGLTSLLFIFGYILLLSKFIRASEFKLKRFLKPIAVIFIVVNVLYFSNIIPPIPLSLKDSVVGHSIDTSSGAYVIEVEKESFLERIVPGQAVHKADGEEVVVYTAIFAPGKLKTDIFHHWQHKENGKWISKGKFSFGIAGGRKEGYRGYSIKSDVPEGRWRVDIETARGQVIGRVKFKVIQNDAVPLLTEITK